MPLIRHKAGPTPTQPAPSAPIDAHSDRMQPRSAKSDGFTQLAGRPPKQESPRSRGDRPRFEAPVLRELSGHQLRQAKFIVKSGLRTRDQLDRDARDAGLKPVSDLLTVDGRYTDDGHILNFKDPSGWLKSLWHKDGKSELRRTPLMLFIPEIAVGLASGAFVVGRGAHRLARGIPAQPSPFDSDYAFAKKAPKELRRS